MGRKAWIIVMMALGIVLISTSAFAAPDHSNFISGPFSTGPEVTSSCLTCHEQQATDFLESVHWQWSGQATNKTGIENEVEHGKKNAINNFCISIAGNETRCTSCHAGYGWDGQEEFDFTEKQNIDCLVCHASADSGYKKAPPAAGNPAEGVDLLQAAQSVGTPTRVNCGSCHFYSGGGDAVKQGDLDSALIKPTREHDVHMGGSDMLCQDCHTTVNHQIDGASLHVIPTGNNRVDCETCHNEPHSNNILNQHMDTVACQTCHIPTFSKELPTKMRWDWSQAGQDIEPPVDKYGKPTYDKMKGRFVWEKNVTPTYAWYNGNAERYILGDKVESQQVNSLSKPVGSITDTKAKIYPFKVHTASQISDAVNKYLITPHLFGGYWSHYDWDKAAVDGMAASGLAYSGEYEFVETEMYMAINHEVVPKEDALQCNDCHSATGVLDFIALGYAGDPMQIGGRTTETGAITVEMKIKADQAAKTVEFPDSQPYADKSGNIMVPIRFIATELGATVDWNGANKEAVITKGQDQLVITVKSDQFSVNKQQRPLGTTATIRDGRIFVAAQPILEALKAQMETFDDHGGQKVIITVN